MRSSAPGKIILFGEHAVVYGRPALAVPVRQAQVDVEVSASPRPGTWIEAPEIYLNAELSSLPEDHPIAVVVRRLVARADEESLSISIRSTIPVASGLGSGAAVSVALARALSDYRGLGLSDEQVNAIAYEVEKLHHGTPSGIDNTVIAYNRPVYFIKGQPIETFTTGKPFTIVIGDTGISAPTRESVGDVRRLWTADPARFEGYFDAIAQVAISARRSIEDGQPELLGGLMDRNHELLQKLTVSCPELDHLVEAARKAGALGAKLSGGGRGGNMIALVDQDRAQSVAQALLSAGARNTIITEIA